MQKTEEKREIIITLRADGSPSAWEFNVSRTVLDDDDSVIASGMIRKPATKEDVLAVLDSGALALQDNLSALSVQLQTERDTAADEKKTLQDTAAATAKTLQDELAAKELALQEALAASAALPVAKEIVQ